MALNSDINEVKQDVSSASTEGNAAGDCETDFLLKVESKMVKVLAKLFKCSEAKTIKIIKLVAKVTGSLVSIVTVVLSFFRKLR